MTNYSEVQREHLASRTLHDAELIRNGAYFTEAGRLAITGGQLEALQLAEEIRNFEKTPEYKLISAHSKVLSTTAHYIGLRYLDFNRIWKRGTHGLIDSVPSKREIDATIAGGVRYLANQGLSISLVDDPLVMQNRYQDLQEHQDTLMRLVPTLVEREDLRFGQQVRVPRNPDGEHPGGYVDNGWTIDTIDATGRFVVAKQDGHHTLEKRVTMERVLEFNPPENSPVPTIIGPETIIR